MHIRSHFNLWQKVFHASYQNANLFEKCPCCEIGKIYLANGEVFKCPRCDGKGLTCTKGYQKWYVDKELTVGQIRLKIDAEKSEEAYMCTETGVGSGTIHRSDHLFETRELAQEYVDKKNNMAGQTWICTRCVVKYENIKISIPYKSTDYRYCPIHGSTTHLEKDAAEELLAKYLEKYKEEEEV